MTSYLHIACALCGSFGIIESAEYGVFPKSMLDVYNGLLPPALFLKGYVFR